MKFFRKLALAALLTALLTGTCLARETFHGAYLQGFPDGSIRPDAAVTRAELAEILYRMMEPEQRRELTCTESAFQDVSARHWAYDAICAMAGARLMLGGSDGCFRPDDGVTGEELSIIFERVRAQEAGKKALPELASGWASQEVTACLLETAFGLPSEAHSATALRRASTARGSLWQGGVIAYSHFFTGLNG